MDVGSLSFRTFIHATEDEDKVGQALFFVSEKKEFERTRSTGYHGNAITVVETKVTDQKTIRTFFERLDRTDIKKLLDTLDNRLDEESFLFLRLDKQEAFLGRLVISDGEDVISVRAKVRSFPQTRENAKAVMEKYLESLLNK